MSTNDSMANFVTGRNAHLFQIRNSDITHLLIIQHNYFRVRSSLKNNTTSAEAIGIDVLSVPNSDLGVDCDNWIAFVQNADINMTTSN